MGCSRIETISLMRLQSLSSALNSAFSMLVSSLSRLVVVRRRTTTKPLVLPNINPCRLRDWSDGRGESDGRYRHPLFSDSHHLLNTSRASALSRPNLCCNSLGAPIIFMIPLSRNSVRYSKYSFISILLF